MAHQSLADVCVKATCVSVCELFGDEVRVELDVEITDGEHAATGRASLHVQLPSVPRCKSVHYVEADSKEEALRLFAARQQPRIIPADDDLAPSLCDAIRWLGKRRFEHAVGLIADHAFAAAC